ncbi:hypothetical protein [Paraburkholderia sp. MM6662-R1]
MNSTKGVQRHPANEKVEGLFRVGSVSSQMQEAAVGLLNAATVSNAPPHC